MSFKGNFLSLFDWENLKYFLYFVQFETLTKTAKYLGVEHATVSRRIEALEIELAIPLVDKRGKKWRLTREGKKLAALSDNISAQMHLINLFSTGRKSVSGTVTISAPPAYATYKLVEPLVRLQNEYPDLRIKLVGSTDLAALNSGEADIAIRLSRPEEGDFIISHIDTILIRPYASQDYLSNTPNEHHNFVGYTQSMFSAPQQQALTQLAGQKDLNFVSNSIEIQMQAAIKGGGIAMLPDFMVQDNCLTPAYPNFHSIERQVWLVIPSAIRNSPAIDAVIQAIKS